MSLKIRLIILTFIFPLFISAQNLEGGLSFGLITYQGDVVAGFVEATKATNLSYGVMIRASLTERINLRANFFRGLLSGADADSDNVGRQSRNFRFKTEINEFSIMGEWNLFGQDRISARGSMVRQRFTPYIFGGVGIILFDPQVTKGAILDPEKENYETFNISVPAGVGIKIGLDDRFVISGEIGGRTAFSDYLDGISKLGNSKNNDWYWMGSIIITYTFGSPGYF